MVNSPLYLKALQKIGRNVVELQKMEAMLKDFLVSMEYEGEVSELKGKETDRRDSISKRTMGTVSGELFDKLFSEPVEPKNDRQLRQWVSFQYRHGGSDEYVGEIKKSFEQAVEERNQLIHHRLLELDPSDDGSCEDVIAFLDDQYERIASLQEFLNNQLKAIFEMKEILPGVMKQFRSGAIQSDSE